MVQQVVLHKDLNTVLAIVYEMRAIGYQQGVDFDFSYNQSYWDDMTGVVPSSTVFVLYNDQLSSWFALRFA